MTFSTQAAGCSCLFLILLASASATTVPLALTMALTMADENFGIYPESYRNMSTIFTLLQDGVNAESWVKEATEQRNGEIRTTVGPWVVVRSNYNLVSASVYLHNGDAVPPLVSYVTGTHDELIFFFKVPILRCALGALSGKRDVIALRCEMKGRRQDFRYFMHMNALQFFLTSAETGAAFLPFSYTAKKDNKTRRFTMLSLYDAHLFRNETVRYNIMMDAVPVKDMYADFIEATGLTNNTQLRMTSGPSKLCLSHATNVRLDSIGITGHVRHMHADLHRSSVVVKRRSVKHKNRRMTTRMQYTTHPLAFENGSGSMGGDLFNATYGPVNSAFQTDSLYVHVNKMTFNALEVISYFVLPPVVLLLFLLIITITCFGQKQSRVYQV